MSSDTFITIDPDEIHQGVLHNHLLSAVAPRPICLASTIDRDGNINLSPFSFFNVFSSNPPIMIFSPARRGRDSTTKHTFENIQEVKQTVINIVNHPIVEQMSLSSTEYGKGVNEFVKTGLTQLPSLKVSPPRVAEAPVSFECQVDQVIELGTGGGAGNLIIARVVLVHMRKEYLDENGYLDTLKLDLVARMGGSWYCRANGAALFEIPKPIRTKGIGVDALPEGIRESNVLTGNNLGRLGNLQHIPSLEAVHEMARLHDLNSSMSKSQIHEKARELLENGKSESALAVLLYAEKLLDF